jgi:Holliday junction resolvase
MPKFETGKNKDNEHNVAKKISEFTGYDMIEFGEFSSCDFLASKNGKAIALVEVRVRSKMYDTFYFAKKKRDDLLTLSKLLRIPAYMAVQFPDTLMYIDISREPDKYSFGGRNDIRVPQDKEDLVEYKIMQHK